MHDKTAVRLGFMVRQGKCKCEWDTSRGISVVPAFPIEMVSEIFKPNNSSLDFVW